MFICMYRWMHRNCEKKSYSYIKLKIIIYLDIKIVCNNIIKKYTPWALIWCITWRVFEHDCTFSIIFCKNDQKSKKSQIIDDAASKFEFNFIENLIVSIINILEQ